MFKNIGKKIMNLTTVLCIIGIVFSVVEGFALFYITGERTDNIAVAISVGIVTAIVLSLICWLSSFALYGFGKLIDNSDKLVKNTEQLLANGSAKPEIITVTAEKDETVIEAPAGDLTWTCEKCGSAVSKDYTYCPLCDYVAKAERK